MFPTFVAGVDNHLLDNTLLLVVHTMSKQLRLFRINFEWSSANSKQQDTLMPSTSCPVIRIQHVKIEGTCSPLYATQDVPDPTSGIARGFMSQAQLSHLDLIPHGPETRNRERTSPTIMAVFSHIPNPYDKSQLHEDAFSIMARWELCITKAGLHPAFDQLASKKSQPAETGDLPV